MWSYNMIPEAEKEFSKLDQSTQEYILAGLKKVATNPLPTNEGGYGKPLGNKHDNNLTGFLKIKFKSINIRVVYTLVRNVKVFNIIVICTRNDDECYKIAAHRKSKHGNDLSKDIFKDN